VVCATNYTADICARNRDATKCDSRAMRIRSPPIGFGIGLGLEIEIGIEIEIRLRFATA
jgi:hypothetical protein